MLHVNSLKLVLSKHKISQIWQELQKKSFVNLFCILYFVVFDCILYFIVYLPQINKDTLRAEETNPFLV